MGQIYSFHRNQRDKLVTFLSAQGKEYRLNVVDTAFEVTKIDGYIGITPLKDTHSWFTIGAEHIETKKRIMGAGVGSGEYRLIWDPDMTLYEGPGQNQEYGADCLKCKKYYPHAAQSSNFQCWACKNGY